jgi:hypothetical protein
VFVHNLHLNEPVVAGEDTTLGLLLKDFQVQSINIYTLCI